MTVTVSGAYPKRAVGVWTPVASPAAGQPWTLTVPVGKAYRIFGGGCQVQTSAAAATRVPFLTIGDGANGYAYADYNQQNGAGNGPIANNTALVGYHDSSVTLPTLFTGLPFPVGVPDIWLPAGTVITGGFQNMQAGDQISQVGLLLESANV